MNLDRYGKLLRLAEDGAVTPAEREVAVARIAAMEKASPNIRAAWLAHVAAEEAKAAAGSWTAQGPPANETPAQEARRRAVAWGLGAVIEGLFNAAKRELNAAQQRHRRERMGKPAKKPKFDRLDIEDIYDEHMETSWEVEEEKGEQWATLTVKLPVIVLERCAENGSEAKTLFGCILGEMTDEDDETGEEEEEEEDDD